MMERSIYVRNAKGGMVMASQARSELPPPCRSCYQVADPTACENKNCKRWQEWFVAQWDSNRKRILQAATPQVQTIPGIPLGGRYYYHPDRLKRYFEKDPCKVCYLAQCVCQEPCQLRRDWENAKEDENI